ncbi:SYCE2 protein, partial [Picathartes gymnocephalus]|nr:SYCE2 protein [Picathartes gymnocephalus]
GHSCPPAPGMAAVPAPGRAVSPLGQVSELTEQLEERLFHLYGFHIKLIQEWLWALAEAMEKVQAKLRDICCTVEAADGDLCL